LQPLQLFIRGRNLASAAPTFYGLSINRGLQGQLVKVVGGVSTTLGTVKSAAYTSGVWVQVTLNASGSQLSVQIFRPGTGQYLNAAGRWQKGLTSALQSNDASIAGAGLAGVNRPARYAGAVFLDDFKLIGPDAKQNFDSTPIHGLPGGWSQWTNISDAQFGASNQIALSSPNSLASAAANSSAVARAWLNAVLPEDVQVTTSIFANSLIPAEVIARGSQLNTATPTYYALSLARGLHTELLRVVNGKATVLAALNSNDYLTNQWIQISLALNGTRLQAFIYRADTGQYLDGTGSWKSFLTPAIDINDAAIRGIGRAGVERPGSYAGQVALDNFEAVASTGDTQPPAVIITNPGAGATVSGTLTIQATATDAGGVARVEFWIDGTLRDATSKAPYEWKLDTNGLANGLHSITVRAFDVAGNVGQATVNCTVNNSGVALPNIPQHYTHIRIAELAYSGTPLGAFEKQLLQNSVDLVVPNPTYLSLINGVAPATPQLIYTNVSNLYEGLYTDWLTYADQHRLDREEAFYHAAKATAWTGDSGSSQPVTWFWSVQRGSSLNKLTNLTSAAHSTTAADVAFGAAGESLYVGFPELFREINVNLFRAAAQGWHGVLEYASAVDANHTPTAWSPLTLLSDGTAGFTRSGRLVFDPPANWKAAGLNGASPLYFIRIRTTAGGIAPVATTILGRDYVGANGTTHGIIPAFDYSADKNGDGYLDNSEYLHRAPGKDARFVYESRIFYPFYGQMRFVTNPSSTDVQQWAADYQYRFLSAHPLADGIFVDNSGGRSPLAGYSLIESAANYSEDYGTLLGAINRRIAPRWVSANTSGGGTETDAVIRNTPASIEEFALRPLAANRQQFEDLAAMVAHRQSLASPARYLILDSLPTGGSPTDARTQIATLAYYYLIGNPTSTFLMFFGGNDPNSSWTQHWSPAAAYNIGLLQGSWSIFAQGHDPANANLTYKVYERSYSNALVLYKPLSYTAGKGSGTLSDATATTHHLNGTYRILRADGTLSAPVTSVTLRNGEGAILIRT
jgi:hypothetical protein